MILEDCKHIFGKIFEFLLDVFAPKEKPDLK